MLDHLPDRSGAIDLVRLIAVTAIVAGHCFTKEVTQDWLYTWHVAVFFILAGYLWRPRRPVHVEVEKRAMSLGRPYVAGFLVLTAALLLVKPAGALEKIAGGIEGGRFAHMPYVTLWFVSALFFTAVAFRVVERVPYAAQWGIALAAAVAGWIWTEPLSHTPLGIGYVATCLIYLLIGDALRRLRTRIRRPLLWGALAFVIGVVLVVTGAAAPLDIKLGDYGTPVFSLLASSAISIGLILVAESVVHPGRFSRACTLLALPLLAVVLLHPLVLWLDVSPWIRFAIGMLVPLAIGLIALPTRAAPWITGQHTVRRAI
ncbi:acyltransferase family protein [Microbacterium sp. XT11]|uniref:acyltransferase family protein n=1 Tax=Microbacterium sp. XT11 TaxID=367477 RepID=UPI000832E591|nr:acyltransferase family protein [Microbacterium sp. XT11]